MAERITQAQWHDNVELIRKLMFQDLLDVSSTKKYVEYETPTHSGEGYFNVQIYTERVSDFDHSVDIDWSSEGDDFYEEHGLTVRHNSRYYFYDVVDHLLIMKSNDTNPIKVYVHLT